MKDQTKKLFLRLVLIAAFSFTTPCCLKAQIFKALHNFAAPTNYGVFFDLSSDGTRPSGGLVLSGHTLYGVAQTGGAGSGTIYSVNTDGSQFTVLHLFAPGTQYLNPLVNLYLNSEGGTPLGQLTLSSNVLYGAASKGGTSGSGALFAINTDGSGFTNLHFFTALTPTYNGTNYDGTTAIGGMVIAGNVLYGVASHGGNSGMGIIFAINTDGTGFTNLHNFSGTNDGSVPAGGLTLAGNILYGTASSGGSIGHGTLFSINTDGSGFTNLHNFAGSTQGQTPAATLVLSGNTLYGTAKQSELAGNGILFRINTDGTGFTNLQNFSAMLGDDTAPAFSGLVMSGSLLFGAIPGGGSSAPSFNDGSLFSLNVNTLLENGFYGFPGNSGEGNGEASQMMITNYTLYGTQPICGVSGTTPANASAGAGSVFSISFLPQLKMSHFGSNVVFTWPTNVNVFDTSGFTLQSSSNLNSTNWVTVSPLPTVVGGQNTVTNSLLPTQMFYRLR